VKRRVNHPATGS